MNQTYLDIARSPSRVAPLIFAEGTFALKGARYSDGRRDCRSTDQHIPRLKRLTSVLNVYKILYEVK